MGLERLSQDTDISKPSAAQLPDFVSKQISAYLREDSGQKKERLAALFNVELYYGAGVVSVPLGEVAGAGVTLERLFAAPVAASIAEAL